MKTNSAGVETVNSFITPKGVSRTLQVEIAENGNVDIDFTLRNSENEVFKTINLNRREALALVFYLIRTMLPNKFLANKFKKEEKREEKK